MRILLTFAVVCVLLLVWAVWQFVPERTPGLRPASAHDGAPPAAAPPYQAAPVGAAVHPAGEGAAPLDVPNGPQPDPEPLPAGPRATGLVHWALPAGYDGALRTVALTQEILRSEPHHVDALRDQAQALLVLRRWPEACTVLARYLELLPTDAELRYELAAALMRQQRWSEALSAWRTLVSQTPEDARCWFNLAVAHQALGHLADALSAWNETLQRAPTTADFARRGEVLLDLHEWDAAADDFARVLAAQPDAEDALLNLCLALRRAWRASEAIEQLRAFIAAHPQHVPALNRLAETAWALAGTQERDRATWRDEARRCWEASLALDPAQDAVREHLSALRGTP